MMLESVDKLKAEEHYRAAIQIFPDYAEAHNNVAVLLHEKGDLAGAERHYSTALRLRPSDAETNYNFALLAEAKGDTWFVKMTGDAAAVSAAREDFMKLLGSLRFE